MTLCVDAPPVETARARRPTVTAKLLVPTEADGYAALRPLIPVWADLLARFDSDAKTEGLRQIAWFTAVACVPTARLYGVYAGTTVIGSVLAQLQDVAFTRRLWIYFCSVLPGYQAVSAVREIENDLRTWAKANGAEYIESETERKPDVCSRRFRGRLHGYIVRSPL